MATLDDKLLGEKKHYYCDSSDDERDEQDERPAFEACSGQTPSAYSNQIQSPLSPTEPYSTNVSVFFHFIFFLVYFNLY